MSDYDDDCDLIVPPGDDLGLPYGNPDFDVVELNLLLRPAEALEFTRVDDLVFVRPPE